MSAESRHVTPESSRGTPHPPRCLGTREHSTTQGIWGVALATGWGTQGESLKAWDGGAESQRCPHQLEELGQFLPFSELPLPCVQYRGVGLLSQVPPEFSGSLGQGLAMAPPPRTPQLAIFHLGANHHTCPDKVTTTQGTAAYTTVWGLGVELTNPHSSGGAVHTRLSLISICPDCGFNS